MSDLNIIEPTIKASMFLGGMCGPEGSISNESFWRRRKIEITVYVEEDSLQLYASDEDACSRLGEDLGPIIHAAITNA